MHSTHTPIISHFDPDIDAARGMLAQADTVDDAFTVMQADVYGRSAKAQIRREMAGCKATAMANLALRRRADTGEDGISMVFPVLEAMGFDRTVLLASLIEAQRLYALGVEASQKHVTQKVLRHGRAT